RRAAARDLGPAVDDRRCRSVPPRSGERAGVVPPARQHRPLRRRPGPAPAGPPRSRHGVAGARRLRAPGAGLARDRGAHDMTAAGPLPVLAAPVVARPRVLFVDDEPAVLEALAVNLRRSFEVVTATSGAAGLEYLRAQSDFAVVVS